MKSVFRLASLPLSVWLAGGAPLGSYDYEIGGADEIWYPAGDDELCETEGADTICVNTMGALTSGGGAVTATGTIHFHFPGVIDMDLPMALTGPLSGTTAKPKLNVAISASGTATLHDDLGDFDAPTTGTGKLSCSNPLPHQAHFACRGRLKLCFEVDGRFCVPGSLQASFGAAGGPWTLSMNLATDPNGAVTGDAAATLANAASEAFAVTGKWKTKSDQSILKLAPTDPLSKNKLKLDDHLIRRGTVRSSTLVFRVAGETGRETFLTGSPPLPSP